MLAITLRFDGSLRGRSGGAGAVLLHEGSIIWQGVRYLEKPATSAHAEYEGLLLGLRSARALGASFFDALAPWMYKRQGGMAGVEPPLLRLEARSRRGMGGSASLRPTGFG